MNCNKEVQFAHNGLLYLTIRLHITIIQTNYKLDEQNNKALSFSQNIMEIQ